MGGCTTRKGTCSIVRARSGSLERRPKACRNAHAARPLPVRKNRAKPLDHWKGQIRQPLLRAQAISSLEATLESTDLDKLSSAAKKAAEVGAKVVRDSLDKPKNISFKGETDLVTDVDKASEAAILDFLQREFPDHAFLGEEGGVSGNGESELLWAIDPLDGTTNFSHNYPSFGVSVAVLLKGQPVAAAVVEFAGGPFAWVDRTFTAARGKGAFCNGQPISVSENGNITRSLLVCCKSLYCIPALDITFAFYQIDILNNLKNY